MWPVGLQKRRIDSSWVQLSQLPHQLPDIPGGDRHVFDAGVILRVPGPQIAAPFGGVDGDHTPVVERADPGITAGAADGDAIFAPRGARGGDGPGNGEIRDWPPAELQDDEKWG